MAGIGRFVAVGVSLPLDISNIGYSTDSGQTWTVVSPTNTNGLFNGGGGYGIATDGNGRCVAVGGSLNDLCNIGYSTTNGQSWTVSANPDGLFGGDSIRSYGNGITSDGNGIFVAVGYSLDDASNIGYSTDNGENWLVSTNTNGLFGGGSGGSGGYGIATDGSGLFVAVGKSLDDLSNIGYSSSGGQNWLVATATNGLFQSGSAVGYGGFGIAYGNGRFVAVGSSDSDPNNASNIGFSPDGQTWTVVSPANTNGLFGGGGYGNGIAYGNGRFVSVGKSDNDASNIGYSTTDGQTWIVSENPDGLFRGGGGYGIAYNGNGVFVAVGDSTDDVSNIGYSPDSGATWYVATATNGLFRGDKGYGIAFSTSPLISNICFPAGTPIKTDQGFIPIEKLHQNKKTINKYTINKQPIQHITKTVTQDPHLICFEKNALGPNVPSARTIMTKEHKILFEGRYVAAEKFLSLSKKVTKVKYNGELLYNVLLANYGTLQVNNLVCETLHPDNLIAKLYNNYKEAERPDLVCQLNASLLERDAKKYKAVERKILHK